MDKQDIKNIVVELKDSIDLAVRETVYEQTKHKDKEVSALHREIKNQLDVHAESMEELKTMIKEHDAFIKKVQRIIESSGYLRKFFLWVLVFVPSIAGFVAGLKYIYGLTINK